MKFSDSLWQQIAPIYQKIIEHPFNVELAQGTLDQERFTFFIEQDSHYLASSSRAMALIAARANSSELIESFLTFALQSLTTKHKLYAEFLPSNKDWKSIEPSPACIAYTHYLIATAATASIEEAIAATLPCFWLYREIGQNIIKHTHESHPYIQWIETYADPEISEGTDLAISILDELANHCSSDIRKKMETAFVYGTLFEWHFWEDAYNMVSFRNMNPTSKLTFLPL